MCMQQRLIELLDNIQNFGMSVVKSQMDDRCNKRIEIRNSDIANYLIDNNVIVPPVKVGQTVYGISRSVIIPIIVDKILYSNDGIDFLGRNEQYFGRSFIHIDVNNGFGIEWYTTKEQAEKALKGGTEQ